VVVLLSQVIIMLVGVGRVPVLTTLSTDSVVPSTGILGTLLRVAEQVIDRGPGTLSSVIVESHLEITVLSSLRQEGAISLSILSTEHLPFSLEDSDGPDGLIEGVRAIVDLDLPSSKVLHCIPSQDRSLTITLTITSHSVGKVCGRTSVTETSSLELGIMSQSTGNTLGRVNVLTVGASLTLHTHRLTSHILEPGGTLLPEALGRLFSSQICGCLAPDTALTVGVGLLWLEVTPSTQITPDCLVFSRVTPRLTDITDLHTLIRSTGSCFARFTQGLPFFILVESRWTHSTLLLGFNLVETTSGTRSTVGVTRSRTKGSSRTKVAVILTLFVSKGPRWARLTSLLSNQVLELTLRAWETLCLSLSPVIVPLGAPLAGCGTGCVGEGTRSTRLASLPSDVTIVTNTTGFALLLTLFILISPGRTGSTLTLTFLVQEGVDRAQGTLGCAGCVGKGTRGTGVTEIKPSLVLVHANGAGITGDRASFVCVVSFSTRLAFHVTCGISKVAVGTGQTHGTIVRTVHPHRADLTH